MNPSIDRLSPAGLSVTEKSEAASLSRILVVDKPRFAQLIQRMLAGQFEVVSAEDPLKSLKAIQAHEPDVIVADLQSGNGLTLAELLDMNVAVPHTPFILMCIQPQADLVDRARKVGVDALVVKPFPPSSLIERIGAVMKARPRSAHVRDEHDKRGVADLIKAHPRTFEGLGPLPDTHVKIMRLEKSEGSKRDDIAEQIEMDPDFANTLLQLANAFTDLFPRKVESLRQAVSFGGFQTIANQAMALHIFRLLGEYKSTSKLDLEAFWKHSVGTGFIARSIGQRLKLDIELCFMAGLLHDAGKLILDRFFSDFFSHTLDLVHQKSLPSIRVEDEVLGVNHAHVGGYLAVSWNLPDAVTEAIVCHHDPSSARTFPKIASVMHIANSICRALAHGNSGEVRHRSPDDPALNRSLLKLGVGPNVLEKFTSMAEEQLERADLYEVALYC